MFLFFILFGINLTPHRPFIHLMNQNPDQYALLREDFDGRIDNAIEEVENIFIEPNKLLERINKIPIKIVINEEPIKL